MKNRGLKHAEILIMVKTDVIVAGDHLDLDMDNLQADLPQKLYEALDRGHPEFVLPGLSITVTECNYAAHEEIKDA